MSPLNSWIVSLVWYVCYCVSMATIISGDIRTMSRLSDGKISPTDTSVVGRIPVHTDTPFLIDEPHTCESSPFAVIFIHSAPDHIRQRDTIRRTWGAIANKTESSSKVLFIIGLPASNSHRYALNIHEESSTYHDILQPEVIDVYANLTMKSVAMLHWINAYCRNVKYVIKTDDDTFVNTPLLIHDLRGIVHNEFMMGDIIAGARPIRDRKSKYFTTTKEFNGSMYPTYLSGAAYVISGDLISSLVQAAKRAELFWLEDVYITGILARRVRAKHVYNRKFALRMQSLTSPCQLTKIIALHRISCDEMVSAWAFVNQGTAKC